MDFGIICIADIVVGTGRGAMEAAIQGMVLLSPVKDLHIPVMVTQNNIEKFLHFNFSERTELGAISCAVEYDIIKNTLLDDTVSKNIKSFIAKYAKKSFEISSSIEQYKKLYANCRKCKFTFFDIFYHYYLTTKLFHIKALQYKKLGDYNS